MKDALQIWTPRARARAAARRELRDGLALWRASMGYSVAGFRQGFRGLALAFGYLWRSWRHYLKVRSLSGREE